VEDDIGRGKDSCEDDRGTVVVACCICHLGLVDACDLGDWVDADRGVLQVVLNVRFERQLGVAVTVVLALVDGVAELSMESAPLKALLRLDGCCFLLEEEVVRRLERFISEGAAKSGSSRSALELVRVSRLRGRGSGAEKSGSSMSRLELVRTSRLLRLDSGAEKSKSAFEWVRAGGR
jgi:hypothetical protein